VVKRPTPTLKEAPNYKGAGTEDRRARKSGGKGTVQASTGRGLTTVPGAWPPFDVSSLNSATYMSEIVVRSEPGARLSRSWSSVGT
jgi:hypothetical protein